MTPDSPFTPIFSRDIFLETLGAGEALRRLDDGLGAREPFLVVTGDAGVGKTAVANEALARWASRVKPAFLAYPTLAGTEFLEEIIRGFGADPPDGADRSKLLGCFERVLTENTGQVAMLIVDDAHCLPAEMLEELRLLVNDAQRVRRPLEVLLIGLSSLAARLDEPALVSLRQRVSVLARLGPLSAAETRRYIHHRIAAAGDDGPSLFSRKTCRDIAARTGGVPRRINTLAAEALRVARLRGGQTVGPEDVQTAAATLGGFVPAGDGGDSADSDSDSPAHAVPSPAPAPARDPVVAPVPAPQPPPPPAPKAAVRASAHVEKPAETAAATAEPSVTHVADAATPFSPTPASQDSRAWVARFVGDRGPVQISSQVLPEPTWAAEPPDANVAETPIPTGMHPVARGRSDAGVPRSRSRLRGRLRLVPTALLAAIVIATAIGLVMRSGRLARSPAPQGAAAMSTAAAPRVARDAPSPRKRAGPYTLDVGGYDDLQTALDQRDRVAALTGFEGWVATAADGGGKSYRVVLGVYRSHERASSAAHMLLRSRTLGDVTVVPLPPRDARQ